MYLYIYIHTYTEMHVCIDIIIYVAWNGCLHPNAAIGSTYVPERQGERCAGIPRFDKTPGEPLAKLPLDQENDRKCGKLVNLSKACAEYHLRAS